jgi:RecJ-like exonuclease
MEIACPVCKETGKLEDQSDKLCPVCEGKGIFEPGAGAGYRLRQYHIKEQMEQSKAEFKKKFQKIDE